MLLISGIFNPPSVKLFVITLFLILGGLLFHKKIKNIVSIVLRILAGVKMVLNK